MFTGPIENVCHRPPSSLLQTTFKITYNYEQYCRDIFSPVPFKYLIYLCSICSVNSVNPYIVTIISGLAEHCGEAPASCLPL
jgi:hypothetical protein